MRENTHESIIRKLIKQLLSNTNVVGMRQDRDKDVLKVCFLGS